MGVRTCDCGQPLTPEEIKYYGHSCNECEARAHEELHQAHFGSDTDFNKGVWFKSSVSGALYRNHLSAGDVESVRIDGVWYDKAKGKD